MHDSQRQAGALIKVTPTMIEAGVQFCRDNYQWTDRRLSEITRDDVAGLFGACLDNGVGKHQQVTS